MSVTEPDVWTEFYLANRRSLSVYALSLTGHVGNAQDLIQDVLVAMVAQGKQPRHLRAYVMKSMRNRAIDIRRSGAGDPEMVPLHGDGLAFVDRTTEGKSPLTDDAVRAMAGLAAAKREIVALKIFAGFTFREIAEILNQPVGTVASSYRRALDELRSKLHVEVRNVS